MRLKHILVATDFSSSAERALAVAARLARRFDAQVTLIHSYDPVPLSYPSQLLAASDMSGMLRDEGHKLLAEARDKLFLGVKQVNLEVKAQPSASVAICEAAERVGADLCVVGTHGRTGVQRALMGSVAERVVRHAPTAVLTVHPETPVELFPERILVTTDFSPAAIPAFAPARMLSQAFNASLTLIHAFESHGGPLSLGHDEPTFAEARPRLQPALEALARDHLADGAGAMLIDAKRAYEGIVDAAEEDAFNLIVIATRGRTGLRRLLVGSVAERVSRHARCAVWTVHSPGSSESEEDNAEG